MGDLLDVLSLGAAAGIIGTYVRMALTGRARAFYWANVIGAGILVPVNLAVGLPGQAAISATFGIVSGVALYRGDLA